MQQHADDGVNFLKVDQMDANERNEQQTGSGFEEQDLDRLGILSQVEAGAIGVEEALRRLEGIPEHADGEAPAVEEEAFAATSASDFTPLEYQHWKWLFLAVALAITAFGGWVGMIGGWWWLCGGPTLLVGVLLLTLAVATSQSPWLHVRVNTGQDTWPRKIMLSIPVPIRMAAWGLRTWGPKIRGLEETGVDELLLAMEGNISKDTPLYVEVEDDPVSGERIQVFFG